MEQKIKAGDLTHADLRIGNWVSSKLHKGLNTEVFSIFILRYV